MVAFDLGAGPIRFGFLSDAEIASVLIGCTFFVIQDEDSFKSFGLG
jgi:hypothetical protein